VLVHYTFHIHPDHKDRAKEELRKLRGVVQRHGGKNFRYFASMTSSTPNRLVVYEVDSFAHFDSLNADPEYRAVKLDSVYTNATATSWGDVPL